jgi:hypothetical protein
MGRLKRLHEETERINRLIEADCGVIRGLQRIDW